MVRELWQALGLPTPTKTGNLPEPWPEAVSCLQKFQVGKQGQGEELPRKKSEKKRAQQKRQQLHEQKHEPSQSWGLGETKGCQSRREETAAARGRWQSEEPPRWQSAKKRRPASTEVCQAQLRAGEQGIQGIANLSKATHTPGGKRIVTKEKMAKHTSKEKAKAKRRGDAQRKRQT